MSEAGPRYALYFAPDPQSPLWRFGSACLGYDAATGRACEALHVPGFPSDTWAALTEEPRRYGFHATLKAPFHLRAGVAEADVIAALDDFAGSQRAFVLEGLRVALLSRFIALVPETPSAPLQSLAASAVEALEPLRAPLSERDLARRQQTSLSDRQKDHLQRWGYPYVFDDFRFHMTLTGALEEAQRAPVLAALAGLFRDHVGAGPVMVETVALFRQERRDTAFEIIRRVPLSAPPLP